MRFLNKVTNYKKSVLSKLPIILDLLSQKDYTVSVLFEAVSKDMTVTEYIDVLDCLFALGTINYSKGVLHYVKGN